MRDTDTVIDHGWSWPLNELYSLSATRVVRGRTLRAEAYITRLTMLYREHVATAANAAMDAMCSDLDRQEIELGGLCVTLGEN